MARIKRAILVLGDRAPLEPRAPCELDRLLQFLRRVARDRLHRGQKARFPCDFAANDAKRRKVCALSRVSDFATLRWKWRIPVRKLVLAASLVVWASPSFAGTYMRASSCKFSASYGYSNCLTTWTHLPDPVRDPEQDRLDAIARAKENEKWTAFCKPTFARDEYGVHRASYAKTGCEFGRSE